MKVSFVLPFLCIAVKGWSFAIGNPGQPGLTNEGILSYKKSSYSLRASYSNDYVYSQQFQGQFNLDIEEEKPPINKLSSEIAQITLNYIKRVDIYGIIGSSKLQIDKEMYFQNELAWGAGAKFVVIQSGNFLIGWDFKYFQTNQNPTYLVSSGIPVDLASDLILSYQEYQTALGLSYKSERFYPYLAATYLSAKISPNQTKFLIKLPGMEELLDANTKSYINSNSLGLAVGGTLMIGEIGTLTIESRFINQNAIDVSFDIHF
jgi:hypothetical protein